MKHLPLLTTVLVTVALCLPPSVYAAGQTDQGLAETPVAHASGTHSKPRQIYFSPRRKSPEILQRALQQAGAGATLPMWSAEHPPSPRGINSGSIGYVKQGRRKSGR
jgi:hypothetical protein